MAQVQPFEELFSSEFSTQGTFLKLLPSHLPSWKGSFAVWPGAAASLLFLSCPWFAPARAKLQVSGRAGLQVCLPLYLTLVFLSCQKVRAGRTARWTISQSRALGFLYLIKIK